MEAELEQEIDVNWEDFGLNLDICEALRNAHYEKPTDVQIHSLRNTISRSDMMVSARTGEGKTLCFLVPILNNLISRYEAKLANAGLKHESESESVKAIQKEVFNKVRALIMLPTRELAIQIKEHLKKIIPEKYKKIIYSCELIGGMQSIMNIWLKFSINHFLQYFKTQNNNFLFRYVSRKTTESSFIWSMHYYRYPWTYLGAD